MQPKDRAMLKLVCLPLKELAVELDTSYSNVRNWSSGHKDIPAQYRRPLAAFMRRHARRIEKAADAMEVAR
jgi:hypothetical protein